METGHIISHIEALVFASDKPLTPVDLTELINNAFGFMEDKITMEQVQTAVDGIVEKYSSEFYPFEMKESGGGWQFLTKKDYHKTVAQLNGEKFLKRLSSASLETLAIIAYKQPITKSDIESIRGVNCDYSIQKLLEKELIVISGRNEEMPGKPLIYNTSRTFMDYFGINSPNDLPKLKEIFSDPMVDPTQISSAAPENQEPVGDHAEAGEGADASHLLVVSPDGELLEEDQIDDVQTGDAEVAVPDPVSRIPDETPDPGQPEQDGAALKKDENVADHERSDPEDDDNEKTDKDS